MSTTSPCANGYTHVCAHVHTNVDTHVCAHVHTNVDTHVVTRVHRLALRHCSLVRIAKRPISYGPSSYGPRP